MFSSGVLEMTCCCSGCTQHLEEKILALIHDHEFAYHTGDGHSDDKLLGFNGKLEVLKQRIDSHISASGSVEEIRRKVDRLQTQIDGLVISRDHQLAQNRQLLDTINAVRDSNLKIKLEEKKSWDGNVETKDCPKCFAVTRNLNCHFEGAVRYCSYCGKVYD